MAYIPHIYNLQIYIPIPEFFPKYAAANLAFFLGYEIGIVILQFIRNIYLAIQIYMKHMYLVLVHGSWLTAPKTFGIFCDKSYKDVFLLC